MTTVVETPTEILHELRGQSHQARIDEGFISLSRAVLVGGLLAAPLPLGAVLPWAWGVLSVLTAILLVFWGREQVVGGRVRLVWSPLYLPGIAFLLVAAIQFYAGLNLDRVGAREALIKLATDTLLFFLATQLFSGAPRSTWRGFLGAVTVFMFAVSVFAILQYFSSRGLIYWAVRTASLCTFGPYGNHNHYAGLMEMLIPIGVMGLLGRRGHNPFRAFSTFAVVVALSSVLLSGSRGGLIALLAEAVTLGAILSWESHPSRVRTGWVAIALGIAASATLFFLFDPGQVSKRLAVVAQIPTQPEIAFAERWQVNHDSARIVAGHPWIGIGLGSFALAYPQYQSFSTDLLWDHAHNDYVEVLAETGTVGGVVIAVAVVMFLLLAFARLGERLKHEIGWIQLGAAIGCCGLLVHSLSDFNLHIPANAAWFAVCAAMATLPGISRQPRAGAATPGSGWEGESHGMD
jgi:O-antigen ligase